MYEDIEGIVKIIDQYFYKFDRYFEKLFTPSKPNKSAKEANITSGDGGNY